MLTYARTKNLPISIQTRCTVLLAISGSCITITTHIDEFLIWQPNIGLTVSL